MSKRVQTAAQARHQRFREQARSEGKRQLGCWISREAAEHLDALREEFPSADIVSAAILAYRNGVSRNVSGNVSRNTPKSSRNGQGLSPEVTKLVKRWRAEGATWAECARRLDEQGIEPPRGGRWLLGRNQTNLSRYFRA